MGLALTGGFGCRAVAALAGPLPVYLAVLLAVMAVMHRRLLQKTAGQP